MPIELLLRLSQQRPLGQQRTRQSPANRSAEPAASPRVARRLAFSARILSSSFRYVYPDADAEAWQGASFLRPELLESAPGCTRIHDHLNPKYTLHHTRGKHLHALATMYCQFCFPPSPRGFSDTLDRSSYCTTTSNYDNYSVPADVCCNCSTNGGCNH